MSTAVKYKPGEFCWADIGTTNTAKAKKFYKGIFGWTMTDVPMGAGGDKYSILRVKGKDVGAIYPMQQEQKKMKAPPAWLPFISVKNVDATVKKAKAARGKLLSGPVDAMDQGRMAVIQDPTGATFALWQARKHSGAGIAHVPGTVCWHDLNTPKTAIAGKFYQKVFGWKTADEKYSGKEYYLFKLGRTGLCGMWPSPMKKLPPSWVTYWNVSDCAKTVAKAKRLGAGVLLGTTLVPEMCRFAILKDPQGAAFGVLQPE